MSAECKSQYLRIGCDALLNQLRQVVAALTNRPLRPGVPHSFQQLFGFNEHASLATFSMRTYRSRGVERVRGTGGQKRRKRSGIHDHHDDDVETRRLLIVKRGTSPCST